MKKRLLITSIVMMLVVAVALSTATYAWFTSNASVTASTVTMTAGTSGSSALGIAWTASAGTAHEPSFNSHYQTNIETYAYTGSVQPAAPSALTNAEPTFYTSYIDAQGKFKGEATTTPVFRFANNSDSGASGYSNLIHVANLAQSGTIGVAITATITGHFEAIDGTEDVSALYDYYNASKEIIASPGATVTGGYKVLKNNAAELVRIAVYEVSGSTYTYKGLISKTAATDSEDEGDEVDPNTAVGTITATNAASALITAASTTSVTLSNIAAQTDQAYAVYVWLDGALFNEAESSKTADVSLTFTAQAAA